MFSAVDAVTLGRCTPSVPTFALPTGVLVLRDRRLALCTAFWQLTLDASRYVLFVVHV